MTEKYLIVYSQKHLLPQRDHLVECAWNSLPISYTQDDEDLNKASYLDLKVNKQTISSSIFSQNYPVN